MRRTVLIAVLAATIGLLAWMTTVAWWARDMAASSRALERAAYAEMTSMTEWTHTLPNGGTIRKVVYRRDYETEAAYNKAVAEQIALFPPDPTPPPEDD